MMNEPPRERPIEEMIELRKQATRRWVTYGTVGVYCGVQVYAVVQLQDTSGLDGLLGLVGAIVGFYFGTKRGE